MPPIAFDEFRPREKLAIKPLPNERQSHEAYSSHLKKIPLCERDLSSACVLKHVASWSHLRSSRSKGMRPSMIYEAIDFFISLSRQHTGMSVESQVLGVSIFEF